MFEFRVAALPWYRRCGGEHPLSCVLPRCLAGGAVVSKLYSSTTHVVSL